ncbi:hypothetical protein [Aeromonas hydrophila]|uniref:hypothetical protein n=1 Tax=Aeromonas hydrophila TaxID=644 RepID=UPI002B4761F6|nr:hypothetical protein [Aeromonas hydrophila]
MKLDAANGYYSPSFFFMKIESDEDINQCIQNNEQTFIHEYIHFLQDLILPYSIRATLISNRDFALVCSTSFHEREITKPFTHWDDDSLLTRNQSIYSWGAGLGEPFINHEKKIISISKDSFDNPNGTKVYAYILDLGDENYHIGARDFLEYIAHKIESKHWKTNHPAYPYKSVDLLFEYLGFDSLSDDVKICIVEFSLYNDNPMNQFMFLMDFIQTKNLTMQLASYNECKSLLMSIQWNCNSGISETLHSKTERRLLDLNESLDEKYNNKTFSSIQEWISLVISYSKDEFANRFIFTELFMLNNKHFVAKISKYIKDIGIPLVFNNKDECVSLLPSKFDQNQFIQLYTAHQFMSFIAKKDNSCDLQSYCNSNQPSIIDENCSTNAIARANCKELCPFGAFVKSYGLHDIIWKDA